MSSVMVVVDGVVVGRVVVSVLVDLLGMWSPGIRVSG